MKKTLLILLPLCASTQLMAMDSNLMQLASDLEKTEEQVAGESKLEALTNSLDEELFNIEAKMIAYSLQLSKELAAVRTKLDEAHKLNEHSQNKKGVGAIIIRQSQLYSLAFQASNWCMEQLIDASKQGDLKKVDYLLCAGINPNGYDGKSPLEHAASIGNESICKLLLEHGATDWQRAIIVAGSNGHKSTCRFLITRFYYKPHFIEEEFLNMRKRIFTALLVFKRLCPTLPRDMRKSILWAEEGVRCEAFVSGIYGDRMKGHENELAPGLPVRAIQIFIQNNIFNGEKTIAALKSAHYERINGLIYFLSDTTATALIKSILEDCDFEIEESIRIKLGLPNRRRIKLKKPTTFLANWMSNVISAQSETDSAYLSAC